MDPNLIQVLSAVSVLNRDDGKKFTNTERLDVISQALWNSRYRRWGEGGLFHLYAAKPPALLKGREVTVVSSHVDCEEHISTCFFRETQMGEPMLLGTFDNAITNAAILHLLCKGSLPDDVVVAFTGDEEETGNGARGLVKFLKRSGVSVKQIFVLDVTDAGFMQQAAFTIENACWQGEEGKEIIHTAAQSGAPWLFVPRFLHRIPDFVDSAFVAYQPGEEDESWYYQKKGFSCCSICLPTLGPMHSDAGILARKQSFFQYTEVLEKILGGKGPSPSSL